MGWNRGAWENLDSQAANGVVLHTRSTLPRNRYRSGPDGGLGVLAPVWIFLHLDAVAMKLSSSRLQPHQAYYKRRGSGRAQQSSFTVSEAHNREAHQERIFENGLRQELEGRCQLLWNKGTCYLSNLPPLKHSRS
jgi:hypothetical protein